MSEPVIPTEEEYINLLNTYAHHALKLFNAGDAKAKLLLHGLTKNQIYEISLGRIFIDLEDCVRCPDGGCVPPNFPCHPVRPGRRVPISPPFPPDRPPLPARRSTAAKQQAPKAAKKK